MAAQKQQAMIAMAQQQAAMSARLAQQRDEQVPTVHTLQLQSNFIIVQSLAISNAVSRKTTCASDRMYRLLLCESLIPSHPRNSCISISMRAAQFERNCPDRAFLSQRAQEVLRGLGGGMAKPSSASAPSVQSA